MVLVFAVFRAIWTLSPAGSESMMSGLGQSLAKLKATMEGSMQVRRREPGRLQDIWPERLRADLKFLSTYFMTFDLTYVILQQHLLQQPQ